MIFDKTGSLATTKRHDYLPFGEELFAGIGGRTPTLGYTGDTLRQQFTSKERDIETGLDYFGARYFASAQGRFTSIDADNYQARLDLTNPQSWNAYSYVNNNPLRYIDPDRNALDDPSFWQQLKEIWHNGTSYGYWMTNAELHAAATAARTQVAVEFGIVDGEGNYRPIDLSRRSDGEALLIRDDLVARREAGQIQSMGDQIPEGPAMQPPAGLGANKKTNGNTNTPNTGTPKADPKLEKKADDLISGSLKRSPSYRSELGQKTYKEIRDLAKKGGEEGKAAQGMKKLIEQGQRLRDKVKRKGK